MITKPRKGVWMLATLLVVLLVAFVGYVRFSPLPAERWNLPVDPARNADLATGAIRVLAGDAAKMQEIDQVMRALPRTAVLAGSIEAGRVTYVTRTAVFGFPDMTTVDLQGTQIALYARLRFGASDLGVNRKRLERVIAAVQ